MKVAIPVAEYCGLDSLVYGHFGSAPLFVLVDTETMSIESLSNAAR
jgi:predicted Fe-Mo cluster-binding NifX family protein